MKQGKGYNDQQVARLKRPQSGLTLGLLGVITKTSELEPKERLLHACFPPPQRPRHKPASSLKPSLTTRAPLTPQSPNPSMWSAPPAAHGTSFVFVFEERQGLHSAVSIQRHGQAPASATVILGAEGGRPQVLGRWGAGAPLPPPPPCGPSCRPHSGAHLSHLFAWSYLHFQRVTLSNLLCF